MYATGLDGTADVLGHTDTRTTINYLDDERRRRTQTARTAAEHLDNDEPSGEQSSTGV